MESPTQPWGILIEPSMLPKLISGWFLVKPLNWQLVLVRLIKLLALEDMVSQLSTERDESMRLIKV